MTRVGPHVRRAFAAFGAAAMLAAALWPPLAAPQGAAATEPRPVRARGQLSNAELATIDIFERTSPSVVYITRVDRRPCRRNFRRVVAQTRRFPDR
jgi:hypothetical protein